MVDKTLPESADVVIVGGGVVGCSVAYHLAKLGIRDVVLLERDQLTSGTTWHAAGLVPQLRGSRKLSELSMYGLNLYPELEKETGQSTGLKQNGSLNIATNAERWEEVRRGATMARQLGVDAREVGPDDVTKLWPLLEISDVVGGIYVPKDGQLNPVDLTMAFAKGARMHGAKHIEKVVVSSIEQNEHGACGVHTDRGYIKASKVVNCAGMWARQLGLKSGVSIPLHACEHFYAITEPMDKLPGTLPVLRDADSNAYYKEDAGKILIGAFEAKAKPWGMGGVPENFSFGELPEDLDHFMPILEGAMERIPALADTGIQTFFNGPESFTADGSYILGEAPELKNYFVAAGFNSVGIQSAAGAGMVLANWIHDERPPVDIWEIDIKRTFVYQNDDIYMRDRVSETLGLLYEMHWPYRQYETSRNVFRSPLHDALKEQGACFGEVAGWERANWFATGDMKPEYEYSFGRQNWFECSGEEHRAVRESVGLFDQTSFAKYRVTGNGSETFLQRICTNNVAVATGKVVYTQWLNEQGGIEADLTVTRISDDEYQIITSPATGRRDFYWLQSNLTDADQCVIKDVTHDYAVISLMGPNSRALLQAVSDADWSTEAMPFGTAHRVTIGTVSLLAQRITYVGELGWELYMGMNDALEVYAAVMEHQDAFDLRLCGYHTLNSCRLEKGYLHWGHDMNDLDTSVEAGVGFACNMDKDIAFIGKDAVIQQRAEGVSRHLLKFTLDDPEPMLYHNETVFRNGESVGFITSGSYGYTLGRSVGIGLVTHPQGEKPADLIADQYHIEIAGVKYAATASSRPFYDPKSERIRS